jgi:Holliday junction resolvase RusA-like endonuclease
MSYWFQLYKKTLEKYVIKLDNIYNRDKKGVALKQEIKVRLIVLKSNKQSKSSYNSNWE